MYKSPSNLIKVKKEYLSYLEQMLDLENRNYIFFICDWGVFTKNINTQYTNKIPAFSVLPVFTSEFYLSFWA